MNKAIKDISIVGAGLVGSLVGVFLRSKGHNVNIFEKRSERDLSLRTDGRSINMAMSYRGLSALKPVELEKIIEKIMIPMPGRMIHDEKGNTSFQPYGKAGQAINSISRYNLNNTLINHAKEMGVRVHYGWQCMGGDFEVNKLIFKSKNAGKKTVKSNIIIGADGANSAVRKILADSGHIQVTKKVLGHGYKELTIPPRKGDFTLNENALHIWPRTDFMLIALPNIDKSFTCTLFLPLKGENSFEKLMDPDDVRRFFLHHFSDASALMPDLEREYFRNPTSNLITVKCYPWTYRDTVLIGDAAHAILPFYGQGMNAGFEDCKILVELLERYSEDWAQAIESYQKIRKKDADAIAKLAEKNFVEMRDKVSDEEFLLRKKIESKLHEQFPEQWIPQYTMVTFTDLPYSKALEEEEKKEAILDEIMKLPDIDKRWNELNYEAIVPQLNIAEKVKTE